MFDLTRLYPHEPYFDDELRLIDSPEAWDFAYKKLDHALFTTTKIRLRPQSYEDFLAARFFVGRRSNPYVGPDHLPTHVTNLVRLWRIPGYPDAARIRRIDITLKTDFFGYYRYWFNAVF